MADTSLPSSRRRPGEIALRTAAPGGFVERRARAALRLLLLAALLPACSGSEEAAIESAHAVFVVQPGCDYVIAKTTGRGYAVLRPTGAYEPRHGDLLVGNLREGTLALGLVPATTDDLTPGVPFEVAGYDLALADAQRRFYGFCPPPTPRRDDGAI